MRLIPSFWRCGFQGGVGCPVAQVVAQAFCEVPFFLFFFFRSHGPDIFRWPWTQGHTRSHSEHGSQACRRRWYLPFGAGRVGSRRIHGPPRRKRGGPSFFPLPPEPAPPGPVCGRAAVPGSAPPPPGNRILRFLSFTIVRFSFEFNMIALDSIHII